MAKVKGKRPAANAQPRTPEDMFQPIGAEDPLRQGDKTQDEPSLTDQLKALTATVDGLVKGSASREERLTNMFMQLATRPQQPAASNEPAAPAIPQLDPTKLPDPTKDPKGYATALSDHASAVARAAGTAVVQPQLDQQNREQRLRNLWSTFTTKYEDLGEYEDIAQVVAGKIVSDAVRGGADPDKVIFLDPDSFMDKVATQMRARIAKIKGSEGEDDEDGEEDDNGQPARTLGIPGATQGGTGGGKGSVPDAGGNLIAELKEIQTKARIY